MSVDSKGRYVYVSKDPNQKTPKPPKANCLICTFGGFDPHDIAMIAMHKMNDYDTIQFRCCGSGTPKTVVLKAHQIKTGRCKSFKEHKQ